MEATKVRDLLQTTDLPQDDEIRKKFDWVRAKPYNNPELFLRVSVPKDWVARPLEVPPELLSQDRKVPVPLLLMGPPGQKDVVLQASYMRVDPSVPLDRVLQGFAKSLGYEIVGRQRGEFNKRPYEEALLRADSKDAGPHLTRMTVYRRGDLVFLIACSAKESEFAKWKRIFATAVVTFDPSGKP